MKVGIRATPYNYELRLTRQAKGYTQKEIGDLLGISQGLYGSYELMKKKIPLSRAKKIAEILDEEVDFLFPPELMARKAWGNRGIDFYLEVTNLDDLPSGELGMLIEDGPEHNDMLGLPEDMDQVLESLSPREAKILRMRFGFDDRSMTLEEVAEKMGVTRERIRIIEARALRKLRHPLRSRRLKAYL